jgi:Fe(3+) dicitrate transport protein
MKRALYTLLPTLLLTTTPGRAQDAPQPQPQPQTQPQTQTQRPPRDVPEVRVIGDKADSLQKIPGSGTLITHKEIERTDPYDTAEMLRRVPGVTATQSEGGGLRLDIGVHGLDPGRSRRVLVLEDGIPLAINPYSEADLYYLPQIERMRGIEVVKGSGSILFGPQTIGGVVNFLTLAPPAQATSAAEVDGGQRGYLKLLAMRGDTVGSARYLVQAFHTRGDGFRNEGFNSTDVFGKVGFDTSESGEAIVKIGFHNDALRSDDVGLTRAMFRQNPGQDMLAPADHIDQNRYDVSVTHEQRFSAQTTLKTLVYAYETKRIWTRELYDRSQATGTTYDHVAGDTTFPGSAIYFRNANSILDRSYDVAAVEPRLTTHADTLGVGHTLDVGGRLLMETAHYKQLSGDSKVAQTGTLDYEFQHETVALAGYVQDRMAFRDWLLVTPGIRLEYAQMQSEILRQGTSNGVANVHVPSSGPTTGVIPGIGMIAGTREAHVFGGTFIGYAPPRITSPISPKGGSVSQLDSERSINYEVGARLAVKKKGRVEATAFLLDFDNQVIQGGASGDTTQNELVNGGKTRHYGVEGEGRLEVGNMLHLPLDLEAAERFTVSRAVFVGGTYDGNVLPYAPPFVLISELSGGRPLGPGRVSGVVTWSYVAAQFSDPYDTRAEDVTGRVGLIPSHNVVDLGARYAHTPTGLTFKLTVKGLADDPYIAARRPEGIQPAGFRQVMLGVRWQHVDAAPTAAQ